MSNEEIAKLIAILKADNFYLKREKEHQKKVIDRLSRKIQRLNAQLRKYKYQRYLYGREVILMSDKTWNKLYKDCSAILVDKTNFKGDPNV